MLASIISGITIPAEELEKVTLIPTEPVAAPAARQPEPAPVAKPEPSIAEAKPKAAAPAAKPKPEAAKPEPKAPAKPDPKAKKPEPKKAEPKKPDPAKTDPSRIWVQVAGGANQASLVTAWKGVVAKAPAAMKGKSGWSTPLRATNRVLAGPFKTSAEAQAFVNALSKSGVSAFVFTSEAGQKITQLSLK